MKKQKENSHEGITWSEMGKQNVQAEKVYYSGMTRTTVQLQVHDVRAQIRAVDDQSDSRILIYCSYD